MSKYVQYVTVGQMFGVPAVWTASIGVCCWGSWGCAVVNKGLKQFVMQSSLSGLHHFSSFLHQSLRSGMLPGGCHGLQEPMSHSHRLICIMQVLNTAALMSATTPNQSVKMCVKQRSNAIDRLAGRERMMDQTSSISLRVSLKWHHIIIALSLRGFCKDSVKYPEMFLCLMSYTSQHKYY